MNLNDLRMSLKAALDNMWARIQGIFSGLDTRVTALEQGGGGGGGGEVNVIESISFNGAVVPPDANKNVALSETDPNVPSWAKANTKPSYTAFEVGAVSTSDVANDLTTTASGKVLDARQGKALKDLIDAIPSGSTVSGVKGDAESAYRTGNINLTPEDIGSPQLITLTADDVSDYPEVFVIRLSLMCETDRLYMIDFPAKAVGHLTEGDYNGSRLKGIMWMTEVEYSEQSVTGKIYTINYAGQYATNHIEGFLKLKRTYNPSSTTLSHSVSEMAAKSEVYAQFISDVYYNGNLLQTQQIPGLHGLKIEFKETYRMLLISQTVASTLSDFVSYTRNCISTGRLVGVLIAGTVMDMITGGKIDQQFIGTMNIITRTETPSLTITYYGFFGVTGAYLDGEMYWGYTTIRTGSENSASAQIRRVYGTLVQ